MPVVEFIIEGLNLHIKLSIKVHRLSENLVGRVIIGLCGAKFNCGVLIKVFIRFSCCAA